MPAGLRSAVSLATGSWRSTPLQMLWAGAWASSSCCRRPSGQLPYNPTQQHPHAACRRSLVPPGPPALQPSLFLLLLTCPRGGLDAKAVVGNSVLSCLPACQSTPLQPALFAGTSTHAFMAGPSAGQLKVDLSSQALAQVGGSPVFA